MMGGLVDGVRSLGIVRLWLVNFALGKRWIYFFSLLFLSVKYFLDEDGF